MTNFLMSENITIDNDTIQETDTYKYLGHEIKISRDNHTHEIHGQHVRPMRRKNSNTKVELDKTLHKVSKNTRWWTVVMTNYGVEDQKR